MLYIKESDNIRVNVKGADNNILPLDRQHIDKGNKLSQEIIE